MSNWRTVAIAEGRTCPECKQPVSRQTWKSMVRKNGSVGKCWTCRYAHWEVRCPGMGGSVSQDNADREVLERIREG